jgi:hypothetical protein
MGKPRRWSRDQPLWLWCQPGHTPASVCLVSTCCSLSFCVQYWSTLSHNTLSGLNTVDTVPCLVQAWGSQAPSE